VNVIINEAVRLMTNNWGIGNDDDGRGVSPDVCPWAPDTLATPLPLGGGLSDNVRCSSWAHWKAHSGLSISVNQIFSQGVTAG